MKKGETIREFMLKEHGIILALLDEFTKNFKTDKSKVYFKKLKDKQDTHVSAEEKAIFILYDEGKKFPEIVTILRQHSELEAMEDKLENEKFYPKLDKELTDKQKHTILKTLQDVILG